MRPVKELILELRSKGHTYGQIQKKLNCSKSTISYHCGKGQKKKTRARQTKRLSENPLIKRIENFSKPHAGETKLITSSWQKRLRTRVIKFNMSTKTQYRSPTFTPQDVIDRCGMNPVCYLTGEQLDLKVPESYSLDHMIPRSRGGSCDIDNLGICTKLSNQAKHDMTPEEFIVFCENVVKYDRENKV